MTLQQIKDEYAKETGFYNSFEDLLNDDGADLGYDVDKIAKLYARACADASLKRASENATISTPWHPSMDGTKNVNKESITNEDNIVLL